MKDFLTPMGLPVVTLDKAGFGQVASTLGEFGIKKAWLADVASVNAAEMAGAVSGVLALVLNWNQGDIERFAALAGSLGISAGASLNPVLSVVALVCLARAYQKAKLEQAGQRRWADMLVALGKGGLGSAVFLAALSALSAHLWVGLMVGICLSVVAHRAVDAGRSKVADMDWNGLAAFISEFLRRHLPAMPRREEVLS